MNTPKSLALAAILLAMGSPAALAQIRIGATLAETGPAGALGDPEAKTLRLLVEQINAAGGVLGEPLELVLYDDGGDPNNARTYATRLVEHDEVVAIIGGTTTGTSLAIRSVAEDEEIPFISLAGGIEIIDPVHPFTFKTPHTDRMACEKIFEDMQAQGITRIGMISGTDGFGASMRNQCLGVAAGYGIEIAADERYAPGDADMVPQLTNIRNTEGVQAVLNPGFGAGPAIVTRNYRQLGIELPFYQSHGVAGQAYIDLSGAENAEGVRLPGTALLIADQLTEDDAQRAVVTAYRDAYVGRYNEPVSTFGGYAHDALAILVDAITRNGEADPDPVDLRDAIEATAGLVGTTGTYSFAADDHLGLDLTAFRLLQIQGGTWSETP
ncbi:ABC transporter substrate-binding protein [Pararhodobacter marinus]|uniref:ABC transporter substrate-binding protein n=1 Tax=Pararhodobacter marinus TaxID=2184063 RepID=UPI0035180F6F